MKTLLLLAGYPGTGKTYLCNKILEGNHDFVLLSPDCLKEDVWDQYGFNSIKEKEMLIDKSWHMYYQRLEDYMATGSHIVSDYPFSDKQKNTLKACAQKHAYQVITVRLIAQIDVLFERQKQRDVENSRHLGHILTQYHKGQVLENRENAQGLLTYKEFYDRCKYRGYDTFELGSLFEVDVTDLSSVDYNGLLDKIFSLVQRGV